jgi:flagellar hook protein FlgE
VRAAAGRDGDFANRAVHECDLLVAFGARLDVRQNGFAPGTLQGIAIGEDGFLSGQFSNGESINLAQIALSSFPNQEGLTPVGNNRLVESRESGQAIVGAPRAGTFGSLRAAALEQSNVDLAAQFVKLIINQRAFQANTRTISVTNELLAQLNNLGQ